MVWGEGGSFSARRVTNPSASESAVYFVRPTVGPTTCAPHKRLSIANVQIQRLDKLNSSTIFDLGTWAAQGSGVLVNLKDVSVFNGDLTISPY